MPKNNQTKIERSQTAASSLPCGKEYVGEPATVRKLVTMHKKICLRCCDIGKNIAHVNCNLDYGKVGGLGKVI